MLTLAGVSLVFWAFYSWPIALGLWAMCGVIALFYAGAVTGDARSRVLKVFAVLVVAMTVVMVGIVTQRPSDNEGAPRMCNRVEC
jgi:hypothetical protein